MTHALHTLEGDEDVGGGDDDRNNQDITNHSDVIRCSRIRGLMKNNFAAGIQSLGHKRRKERED